jgi:hypothetical protein
VEFDSGCVANFTASRVSTERVRKLRFFEPRQYVSIDYARRELLVIRLDAEIPGTLPPEIAAMLASGMADPATLAQLVKSAGANHPSPGLSFVKPEVAPGEPLCLEIESFLDSVRTRREPRVTARQGRDALSLALEIQAAMVAHAHRAGLENFFESSY